MESEYFGINAIQFPVSGKQAQLVNGSILASSLRLATLDKSKARRCHDNLLMRSICYRLIFRPDLNTDYKHWTAKCTDYVLPTRDLDVGT